MSVRNATRLLWETARKEAEQVQEVVLEKARAELKNRKDELERKLLELIHREEGFAQTRARLDQALASFQQAREALDRQVTALASEGLRQREAAAKEMARLNALLGEAQAVSERLRAEHAVAFVVRGQDLRQAAQQLERELRDQLAVQSTSLVQAQSQRTALQQRVDDLHQALLEEKKAHELTHGLLAEVPTTKAKPSVKRTRVAKPE